MFDYYLRFDSKEQAYSVLSDYILDGVLCGDRVTSIDEIGTLYTYTLIEDSDPVMHTAEAKPGYHVNIRSRVEQSFEHAISPETPSRLWA